MVKPSGHNSLICSALHEAPTIHCVRHICYLPGGRSVWEITVPEVLSTARVRGPRAILKTKGTLFSHTDRPSPVNNIFFSGRLLFKVGKGIGIKDIAYVGSRVLKSTKLRTPIERK